ncbi:alpha/beta fold hydrolase [Pseudaminobacter soli (ex Li et al. 2025)]|uniref:Alpha/beta hydrolase n=1 Tax=Pseudaminobacter soli (ex Li et al. 2025) TaxID=1295366 RepID=A0A2P7S351_9HYPH|nr:alpha/beta hydrolase [Mesorhizobium soli]PSJ56898.1 alpha/beta hydrolase [Mesorhizobium soli]
MITNSDISPASRNRAGCPAFTEQGSGATPVLFLHGIGGGADSWLGQLEFFGRSRHAIAWWMPGYGPSAPLPDMTFDALADAAVTLLDRLALPRVHLVGHSIGGMIAQTLAARAQGRLASLTLSATSPAFGSKDGDFQKAFVEKRIKPLDDGFSLADLAPKIVAELVGDNVDMGAIEDAIASMSQVPPASYRAAMSCVVHFDARPVLPTIRVPTLLVAGSQDTNAPAPMMERMAQKIAGSCFHVVEGAGHLANMEQAAAFNQILSNFIADIEDKGSQTS